MNSSPHRPSRLALAVTVILTALAFTAASASAAVFKLETFKTSIDVKLNLTEHSNWNGMQPGCTAPEEKFDITYQMRVDSTPSRKSDIKNGTTTLSNLAYGTTPSYGDKSSFYQYSSSAPWELETQYPASCNAASPPVPSWATSPTCKKVYNRVESHLLMSANGQSTGDGSIVLNRVSRIRGNTGSNIGPSCNRTLHNIATGHFDTKIGIDQIHSFIQLPIANLESKLEKISRGARKSRPSFKVKFNVSGPCNNVSVTPSIGEESDFLVGLTSTPHQALGSHNGDPARSTCTFSGKGAAIVRREGAVRTTRVSR